MPRNVNPPSLEGAALPPETGLALAQALETAVGHHRAGRLREAKAMYREILRRHPRSAGALHFLGVIAHQEGQHDLAIELMSKAIAENRTIPVFHGNLGEIYRMLGRFDEAIATLRRAVEFKPDLAVAHANLGNVLRAQGQYEKAVKAYRRALRLDPAFAGAHAALGNALQAQGRSEEAVASYRRALEITPNDPTIWSNLGAALRSLGRTEEAVESFRRAVRIKPDLAAAHTNLGMALLVQGKLDEAVASYETALRLKRGLPGRERDKDAGETRRDPTLYATFRFTAENKLRHDIEQFRYLVAKGIVPASFDEVVGAYESVLAEVRAAEAPKRVVALTSEQQERIGDTYNRAVHIAQAPACETGSLNPGLDARAIEGDYHGGAPETTFVDTFLTPEALDALRRFCLESTIWYDFSYEGGYLGAYMSEGFSCGLLFQIAEDLRTTFPGIFGDHRLREMWAYKYDSRMQGIALHADAAAVNVNFWITPDDANLDPDSGGLVVYKREAPLEWDFEKYNKDQESIRAFLAGSDSLTVPYRHNRVVIFNSNLFHRTDAFRFKDGYENRRINITMLFGFRGGPRARG